MDNPACTPGPAAPQWMKDTDKLSQQAPDIHIPVTSEPVIEAVDDLDSVIPSPDANKSIFISGQQYDYPQNQRPTEDNVIKTDDIYDHPQSTNDSYHLDDEGNIIEDIYDTPTNNNTIKSGGIINKVPQHREHIESSHPSHDQDNANEFTNQYKDTESNGEKRDYENLKEWHPGPPTPRSPTQQSDDASQSIPPPSANGHALKLKHKYVNIPDEDSLPGNTNLVQGETVVEDNGVDIDLDSARESDGLKQVNDVREDNIVCDKDAISNRNHGRHPHDNSGDSIRNDKDEDTSTALDKDSHPYANVPTYVNLRKENHLYMNEQQVHRDQDRNPSLTQGTELDSEEMYIYTGDIK